MSKQTVNVPPTTNSLMNGKAPFLRMSNGLEWAPKYLDFRGVTYGDEHWKQAP